MEEAISIIFVIIFRKLAGSTSRYGLSEVS